MIDKIDKLLNSTIQHGKENDRIYLMHLDARDPAKVISTELEKLAAKNSYSKIFIKVPEDKSAHFESCGFEQEAIIPNFFQAKSTAVFMSKYLVDSRREIKEMEMTKIKNIISLAEAKAQNKPKRLNGTYKISKAMVEDALEIAEVYKEVFATYPFPIHDPEYIKKTMETHIDYYVAKEGSKIVAVSSAEMDLANLNVEMTDFATLETHRGNDLSLQLLEIMEQAMKTKGLKVAYTIARSLSAGMNICFSKSGYNYSGTLKNNTNICGKIESMNVWYKKLI